MMEVDLCKCFAFGGVLPPGCNCVSRCVCVLYGAEDFKSAVGNTQMCADVLRVYSGLIRGMCALDRSLLFCCCLTLLTRMWRSAVCTFPYALSF